MFRINGTVPKLTVTVTLMIFVNCCDRLAFRIRRMPNVFQIIRMNILGSLESEFLFKYTKFNIELTF